MTTEAWIAVLLGGGGITGLFSVFLTRKQNKTKTQFDMIDRLYEEIKRLDEIIVNLRNRIAEYKKEVDDLKEKGQELEMINYKLQLLVDQITEERDRLKKRIARMRQGGEDT